MNSQDDKLASALLQLRAASNPRAGAKAQLLAALQVPRTPAPPATATRESLVKSVRRAPPAHGPLQLLKAARTPLAWSLALSVGMFLAGFGIGRNSAEPTLGDESAAQTPVLAPPPSPVMPLQAPRDVDATEPSKGALEQPVSREAVVPAPASAEPAAGPARREPQSKRRTPAAAVGSKPKLGLAEALQLLQRADRAIYSGDPAWALSLLDELDARADRAVLREERVATRVLALCRDGQVEVAERLARAARAETPGSIYGALLERACNPPQRAPSSTATDGTKSTPP